MKQGSLIQWLQRSPENQRKVSDISGSLLNSPSETKQLAKSASNNQSKNTGLSTLKSPSLKTDKKYKEQKSKKAISGGPLVNSPFAKGLTSCSTNTTKSTPVKKPTPTTAASPMSVSSDSESSISGKTPDAAPNVENKENVAHVISVDAHQAESQKASIASDFTTTTTTTRVPDSSMHFALTGVKVPLPSVRAIKCPENFNSARIPDILLVTEFLRRFGCLFQKKKKMDPEPDFHILLNAICRGPEEDPLYLCGIIFHLATFASKQAAFSKLKYLGQSLSTLDLSVQSCPEILRVFLSSLPPKSLLPAFTDELAMKYREKGFFALSPEERLDVLATTVNWLVATPNVVDHITKKEDIFHKQRGELFRLRRQLVKDQKSVKDVCIVEPNQPTGDAKENAEDLAEERKRQADIHLKSVDALNQKISKLSSDIADKKLAVEKTEKEYNDVRSRFPIGVDREGNKYWQFDTFSRTSVEKVVLIENKEALWNYYNLEDLYNVISSMQSNPFAVDFHLRMHLEGIAKETQAVKDRGENGVGSFLEEDVEFSAGILEELAANLLDSEARIYAAAFADPLPDVDEWRDEVKSVVPEGRPKRLAQCLLKLANSIHLKVIIPEAKMSAESLKKKDADDEKDNDAQLSVLFFAADSYFAKWKEEVTLTESPSRLLMLLDVFLSWLNWSMSAEHARCRRCRRGPNAGVLILCDKCNRGYHLHCLDPLLKDAPDGEWFCPECARKPQKADMEDASDDNIEVSEDSEDSDDDSENELREPDSECRECLGPETECHELVSCSICYHSYHLGCLNPPLRYPPRGIWYCRRCLKSKSKRKTRRVIYEDSPSPPRPKAKAVKKSARATRYATRSSRDVPSRNSSRQTTSRNSTRSASPPPQIAELSQRYSFRTRNKPRY